MQDLEPAFITSTQTVRAYRRKRWLFIATPVCAYDSMLCAQAKDLDGALNACKCIVHCGRAIGDEPSLISMLVRIALHRVALERVERTLAQGEATRSLLANLQQLLEGVFL